MGNSGGEAASLREAPLPQTPSPEERLGFELVFPSYLRPPASWARVPAAWLWSRRLTEPPRPAYVERTRLAREAASLREAPPSRSLPKSGWRLRDVFLQSWFRLYGGKASDRLG